MQALHDSLSGLRPNGAAASGLCLVQAIITNDTGSSIRTGFPVVTPIAFRDLTLVYRYADESRSAVPLYDRSMQRSIGLESSDFYLTSLGLPVRHPEHGPLVSIVLRGYFGTTDLCVQVTRTREQFVVKVDRDFSVDVKHPSADTFLAIQAIVQGGGRINVGTFSMIETSVAKRTA